MVNKLQKIMIISYLYLKYVKVKRKRNYRFWARALLRQREVQGGGQNLINELRMGDLQYHINYFRLPPESFDVLLGIVVPKLSKAYLVREPISAGVRLAVTLRLLASGDSMISLTYAYRFGKSTVCQIIHECLKVIWESLQATVLLCPNENSWKRVAEEFNSQWNSNCVGAIDGKHITAPAKSGSMYYNYKGHHSIVLMAACDANCYFNIVDIGAPGRLSDGGIFRNSTFGQMLQNESLCLPEPISLLREGPALPYVFVGDEAFQ